MSRMQRKHAGQRQNESLAKMGITPLPKVFTDRVEKAQDEIDVREFIADMGTTLKVKLIEKGLTEEEQTKTLDSLGSLLLATWLEARRSLREGNNGEPTDDSPIVVE